MHIARGLISNCKLQDKTSLPWEKFCQLFCVVSFLHGVIEGMNTELTIFLSPEARGQ